MTEVSILLVIAGSMLLLITLFNAIAGPFLKNSQPLRSVVPVSVLVPARNEENNIRRCLESLLEQDYPDLEILVLDDHSSDGTAAVVRSLMGDDIRLRLLTGEPLPDGWTGKNWACHQLQAAAGGEVLIFCDADTWHNRRAVRRTISRMQAEEAGLLSTFPEQETITLAEQLVIPVIDMFVYSGLPLWLTRYSDSPLFAAANGQWIAITRAAYQATEGHSAVRKALVEDVALSKLVKEKGIPMILTAGKDMIYCRMYRSGHEVWEGFTKNLFGIFGYSTSLYLLVSTVIFFGCIAPYFMIFVPDWQFAAATLISINLTIRLLLVVRFGHPFFSSILLHPLGIFLTLLIGMNSLRRSKMGSVDWKDRKIPVMF